MANSAGDTLSQERLREILEYNPETGLFVWKVRASRNVYPGTPIYMMRNGGNYVQIQVNKKLYYTHRLAWLYVYGVWPKGKIDHIDGVKTNNRIENLRDVDTSTNAQNQRKAMSHNKSGVLGVGIVGSKFRALIQANGKQQYLGTFTTSDAASTAYLNAKRSLHAGCTI